MSAACWALMPMVLVAAVMICAASSNSMAEILAYWVVATRRSLTCFSSRPCRQNSVAATAISVAETFMSRASLR